MVKASDTVSATGASSTLANVGDLGSGGEVIFFSKIPQLGNRFVISAQGGQVAGNGGFVELSGLNVQFAFNVSTLAPMVKRDFS